MFAFGFLILAIAVWLGDSAIQNRSPIATLEAIIKDPKSTRTTLLTSKGTGFAKTPTASTTYTGPPASGVGATTTSSQSTVSSPSPVANAAVSYAVAQLGKPYLWGATGPNAFDCSGLCYAAYKSAGMTIPRTTATQLLSGKIIKKKDLQPGDLIFPYVGHVFMYVGNGQCVEAPRTGKNVQMTNIYAFMTARRFA